MSSGHWHTRQNFYSIFSSRSLEKLLWDVGCWSYEQLGGLDSRLTKEGNRSREQRRVVPSGINDSTESGSLKGFRPPLGCCIRSLIPTNANFGRQTITSKNGWVSHIGQSALGR